MFSTETNVVVVDREPTNYDIYERHKEISSKGRVYENSTKE